MAQRSESRGEWMARAGRFAMGLALLCSFPPSARADVVFTGAQKEFSFPISFFADIDFTMLGFDDGDPADDGDATLLVQPDPGPLPFTFTSLEAVGLGYDVDPDAQVATGSATVQGAGAVWEAPIIALGPGGVGALSVLDGGRVDAFVHVGGYYEPATGFGGLVVDLGPGDGMLTVSGPGSLLTGSLKLFDVFNTVPQIPAGASFVFSDGAGGDLSLLELTGYEASPQAFQGIITGSETEVHADVIAQRGLLRIEQGAHLTSNAFSSGYTSYEGARV